MTASGAPEVTLKITCYIILSLPVFFPITDLTLKKSNAKEVKPILHITSVAKSGRHPDPYSSSKI